MLADSTTLPIPRSYGRSLGTGPTLYLATLDEVKDQIGGVILESAFTSVFAASGTLIVT